MRKVDENIILELQGITKSFVTGAKKTKDNNPDQINVLNNLHISFPKNKIIGLIGGNGAGKTTMVNIIFNLIQPDAGKVFFDDGKYRLDKLKPYQIARLGNGRLFQDNHIFPKLTIMENMIIADKDRYGEKGWNTIFHNYKNRDKAKIQKAEHILESIFGQDNEFLKKKDEPAQSLSYGQQRLLGLAGLLMSKNKLLLLDEPTSGVHPRLNNNIADIIHKMVDEKQMSIILIEHNMRFVREVCDLCAFMQTGSIHAYGKTNDVLDNAQVRKQYLGE